MRFLYSISASTEASVLLAVGDRLCLVTSLHCLLAGHDRTGTTVWLALTLWTIMALGEAALLAQSSMCMAVWCAIFGLPSLYLQCRHILDVLVEESLQLVAAFLRAGPYLPCFERPDARNVVFRLALRNAAKSISRHMYAQQVHATDLIWCSASV